MECPECGQGWIEQVRVKATDEILYVCEECDATWFKQEHIGLPEEGCNFETHLLKKGLSHLRDEVEVLCRDFDL